MYPNQSVANNGVHAMNSTQQQQQQQNLGYNGLPQQQPQQQQHKQQSQSSQLQSKSKEKKPFVRIIEQPASKALRFRYECEGRSAGSIPGVNSTPENKTFPTIEIVGHKGKAVVVVSCVTKDQPYRPHPHNLVGKEGCKKGVCTVAINEETMRSVFSNLGIQCVKKKDIDGALKAREEIRVDPFKTGFEHRCQPSSIDLNSVRLCFQVFIEKEGRFTVPLAPVVSDPIYDKKAMSDLVICRLCSCSTTVLGNTQIMLLCEKVAKDDISVRFFEETNGQTTWEAFGDFQQNDVHKQTAIAFRTPRYHTLDIKEPAKVFIQLKRPSDGVTSEALPFEFIPLDSDPVNLRRKRQKTSDDTKYFLIQQQQQQQHNPTQRHKQSNHEHNNNIDGRQTNVSTWNALIPPIKTEPRETSPQPFGLYRNQAEMTPSPQPHSPASMMYNQQHNNPNMAYNLTPTPAHTPGMTAVHQAAQLAHQAAAAAAAVAAIPNEANMSPMDVQSGYGSQQQQQQQQSQQQTLLHQHQQQFQHQMYVGTANWTTSPANTNPFHMHLTANNNNNNNNPQAVSNLRNEYLMQNMMTAQNEARVWNIPPAGNLHEQQQQQQQQYMDHQQQYQQHSPNPTAIPTAAAAEAHHHHNNNLQNVAAAAVKTTNAESTPDNNNDNENGPTISNLLNFDSGQLLHLDSEDQQDIQLDTEDLQISNLSLTS